MGSATKDKVKISDVGVMMAATIRMTTTACFRISCRMRNFCQRFYNRQFVTRKLENTDVLMRFHALLRHYYETNMQWDLGLPTVQYCADKLCMSANYFGDLIKKTTGETASNYIRQYIIQKAENELASGAPTSQVAYDLGFDYPQHFSRLFKKYTGQTPTEYVRDLRDHQ